MSLEHLIVVFLVTMSPSCTHFFRDFNFEWLRVGAPLQEKGEYENLNVTILAINLLV